MPEQAAAGPGAVVAPPAVGGRRCRNCRRSLKRQAPSRLRPFCGRPCYSKWSSRVGLHAGKNGGNWKGGVSTHAAGYLIYSHGRHLWKLVHRVKMEKQIGRALLLGEVVHHKNGIKTDNRLCNLQIMSRAEHASHHARARAHGQ